MDVFLGQDQQISTDKKLKDIIYALNQSSIVAITDPAGRIFYSNKKFTEISQYQPEETLSTVK